MRRSSDVQVDKLVGLDYAWVGADSAGLGDGVLGGGGLMRSSSWISTPANDLLLTRRVSISRFVK